MPNRLLFLCFTLILLEVITFPLYFLFKFYSFNLFIQNYADLWLNRVFDWTIHLLVLAYGASSFCLLFHASSAVFRTDSVGAMIHWRHEAKLDPGSIGCPCKLFKRPSLTKFPTITSDHFSNFQVRWSHKVLFKGIMNHQYRSK